MSLTVCIFDLKIFDDLFIKSINLKGGPVFVKVPEPLAPINKEETIKLECIVEATPKPTINWFVYILNNY